MNILEAHKFCSNHKKSINKSKTCGCFYCIKMFTPKAIEFWLEEGEGTALCPYCGIDSVIGDADVNFDINFLKEMNKYWFSQKQ